MDRFKIIIILGVVAVAFPAVAFAEGEIVVASELILHRGLMGLAGIVVAGLFCFGVIKNI